MHMIEVHKAIFYLGVLFLLDQLINTFIAYFVLLWLSPVCWDNKNTTFPFGIFWPQVWPFI